MWVARTRSDPSGDITSRTHRYECDCINGVQRWVSYPKAKPVFNILTATTVRSSKDYLHCRFFYVFYMFQQLTNLIVLAMKWEICPSWFPRVQGDIFKCPKDIKFITESSKYSDLRSWNQRFFFS